MHQHTAQLQSRLAAIASHLTSIQKELPSKTLNLQVAGDNWLRYRRAYASVHLVQQCIASIEE